MVHPYQYMAYIPTGTVHPYQCRVEPYQYTVHPYWYTVCPYWYTAQPYWYAVRPPHDNFKQSYQAVRKWLAPSNFKTKEVEALLALMYSVFDTNSLFLIGPSG